MSQPSIQEVDGGQWLPARILLDWTRGGAHRIDWCFVGDMPLLDPFYQQTIAPALCGSAAECALRSTPLELLHQYVGKGLPPSGFIFHMSRCGSTLIAQMLAAVPGNRVISEATVIDTILHSHLQHPEVSDDLRAQWLCGLVAALGRPREGEQRLFVKFDSWHALQLPFIRKVFPSVPWIFVYRNPLDVLASHARQDSRPLTLESAGRRIRVLRRFCQSALAALDVGGMFVDYGELPEAVTSRILPHFGAPPTDAEIALMARQSRLDAKDPTHTRLFASDSEAKRRELSPQVCALVERELSPVHAQLERMRGLK
jgi:hypothetical protein